MRRVLVTGLIVSCDLLAGVAVAQGTKLWTVSRYDEMERGTTDGVAIRSDGRLEPGPATSLLYATGGNYVWSVAADAAGNAYVGMGGTASGGAVVMKVAPDGKATKVFEGKELGVQALRVGADGRVYAATSPDGKVYRLGAGIGDAAVVFDPAQTEEKPKYLWDIAFKSLGAGKGGDIYIAAGAPAVVYRVPAGGGKAEVVFKTVDQHIRCLLMGPDGTLWAGTDGNGVIYRLKTTATGPEGKPFAVYSAPKREITALAMDSGGECLCLWCRRETCGGGGDWQPAWAAAASGDGLGGSDDHVFAAGIGECGDGEYADPGGLGDLSNCGRWQPGEAPGAKGRCGLCAGLRRWRPACCDRQSRTGIPHRYGDAGRLS